MSATATAAPATTGAGAVVVQAGEPRSARVESLRAVAALAVVVSHVWLYAHRFGPSSFDTFAGRLIAGGGFGVQLFFALSGYLIFRPFARRDFGDGAQVSIETYARNRAVRILPLYWSAVVVLLVFTQHGGSTEQWWRFTTFTEGFSARTAQTVDAPLWSVVVELQFYVLLPLLAWLLARACRGNRLTAIAVLVVLAVPSVVFRRIDPDPTSVWRFSLPATFYGFVPGMVLALVQVGWDHTRLRARGIVLSADAWFLASGVLWAASCWNYGWTVPLTAPAAFLTVGAVVLPLHGGRLVRSLDWRPLALVGVASYSLYVWHVPIIERLYARPSLSSWWALLAIAAPLSLLVAVISYVVIERPALALRRGWATSAASATPRRSAPGNGARRRLPALLGEHRAVAALVVVGFLARARMVMATQRLVLSGDPADYDRLGRLLAAGKGFGTSVLSPSGGPTAFRPPLYPLFLGAVYKVTGGSMTAARLVQAAAGAAAVVLVFLLARRFLDRRASLVAAAIAALYPPLLVTSAALMSEAIFVPIMLAALLCALAARDGGPRAGWWAAGTGALVGLGLLARPNSLTMVPAVLLLVAAWRRRSWQWRPGLVRATLVLLGCIAVLVPWQVRNATTMSRPVFIADIDGFNLAGTYNAESATSPYPTRYQFRPPNGVAGLAPLFSDPSYDEATLSEELRSQGLDHIRSHPTAPVQALVWNSFRMLELSGLDQSTAVATEAGFGRTTAIAGLVAFWVLLVLAVLGASTRALLRVPWALWLAPGLLWVGTTLFLGNARLRAPIEPFLVLLAAPAAVALYERARNRVPSPRVATARPT